MVFTIEAQVAPKTRGTRDGEIANRFRASKANQTPALIPCQTRHVHQGDRLAPVTSSFCVSARDPTQDRGAIARGVGLLGALMPRSVVTGQALFFGN